MKYRDPGVPLHAGSVDPDVPTAGLYRMRLVKGAVWSAIRIWFGPPHDPVTGEEMDRSHRWQASINGKTIDHITRVWPRVAEDSIDQAEYDRLMALQKWSEQHDPDGPFSNPAEPVDRLNAPLPF